MPSGRGKSGRRSGTAAGGSPLHAAIVTRHEDTLDDLDAYLKRAGIATYPASHR